MGHLASNFELANKFDSGRYPLLPFDAYSSFTQGYIGYHLQNTIGFEFAKNKIKKSVQTLITQVLVDENDCAFKKPSKPIGAFYTKNEAERLSSMYNYHMGEDSGRGWRRLIASPNPIDIVEKRIIFDLFSKGHLPICCGGGGIPVIKSNEGSYKGNYYDFKYN